ncbi:MAG TPA: NAD(P)H-hydrate epimerase, partial [bacterium]|nr:NAD(P)H-hydrate epimerase [bacterium]
MRVLRANEIRALDQAAIQRHGIGSLALMERAGRGCAEAMLRRIDRARRRDMQVFCGKGNNGGDGLVVARYLAEEGCRVKVYLTHPPSQGTPQLRANLEKLPRAVRVVELAGGKELPEFSELLGDDDVVVDALLGVGLQGDLGEPYRGIIASLNEFAGTVVAIDVPSGTGNDNGQVTDPAIRADLTLTIGFPKVGLYLEPATFHAGEIELIPLDYP